MDSKIKGKRLFLNKIQKLVRYDSGVHDYIYRGEFDVTAMECLSQALEAELGDDAYGREAGQVHHTSRQRCSS